MSTDRAAALIGALGRAVGIDALALGEGGTCTLRLDDVLLTIELDADDDRLVLHTVLGPLPVNGQAELLARLLEGNLFWKDTQGATLALDRPNAQVVLFRAVPLDSPPADFPGLVERFVDCAEAWREVIAQAFTAVPEPAATSAYIDPMRFA